MAVGSGSRSTWDAATAIAHCTSQPWTGSAWRYHRNKYSGDSPGGSIKSNGRFNRGAVDFPSDCWLALYTGLAPHVALGEIIRNTKRSDFEQIADKRQSQLWIELQAVLNLCKPGSHADINVTGLTNDDMCHPTNYTQTQEIARVARGYAEAIIVPSCTRYPEGNLIVFPDRLRPGSVLRVEATVDPELFIDWDNLP